MCLNVTNLYYIHFSISKFLRLRNGWYQIHFFASKMQILSEININKIEVSVVIWSQEKFSQFQHYQK